MPLEFVYRSVRSYECQQVVDLHRSVFSSEYLARTIYASSHIDRYLANLIAFPHLQKEHLLWGCWSGDNLVGYAHFRALPESWHLNYIAVLPAYQGHGIGQILWTRWTKMGRERGYSRISVDVERENRRALDWYQRQGLQIVQTVWTYERSIEDDSVASARKARTVRLLDWEQSEARQLSYGFSQFCLVHQERIWTVGRLGRHYFRARQQLPLVLEGVLAEIDPARRLLILSSEPIEDVRFEEVEVSFQMQGEVM